ncbi:MAG: ABC transporter permease [Candidatus Rokubacteria bacterium]|nr:ABC transporter permease [Candidatus Rokubacteria bacterium]
MKRSAASEYALILLTLLLVLGPWEGVVRAWRISPFIVPPPSAIGQALFVGFRANTYTVHLLYTLAETLLGFFIGAAIGCALGIFVARSLLLERIFYPYVIAFQAMPKIAIAPLLVLWFGFGIWSKVAMASMIAFFPVLVNVITGLRAVDRDAVDLLRSLSATEAQIFRMVQLPTSLPYVFAGLDIAIVFSLLATIVAEFVGSQVGMGNLILQMNFALDVAGVFAVLMILSAVGVGLHLIVVKIQRRVIFWSNTGYVMGT